MKKGKQKLPGWIKGFLVVMVGVVLWTAWIMAEQEAQACAGSQNGSSPIVHQPTISVQTIKWELQQRGSPLSTADATYIYQESQRYNIDDAFAIAVWAEETQDGRTAYAGTYNIGNMEVSDPKQPHITVYNPNLHLFRIYPDWQASIDDWFSQTGIDYVKGGFATDLLTFALMYDLGITRQQATQAQIDAMQQPPPNPGYVWVLNNVMSTLQQYEAQHPAGSTSGSSSGNSSTQPLTLASLIPNNLSPGWAGPGALQAATLIPLGCTATGGSSTGGTNPMVQAAMQLATYLKPDGNNSFDIWGAGTPSNVISNGDSTQGPTGTVWCTDFVASAYQVATSIATGKSQSFPVQPYGTDAGGWLDGPVGTHQGFERILAGPGSFPQAGDIIVLQDGEAGHVAIAVGVQLPQGGQNGWVLVAQGHATTALEKWTLYPDGTLMPNWGYWTHVPGYIRIPALAPKSPNASNLNDYPWQGLTYANGSDPWGMLYGQCVSYVAWKIYELYGGTQRPPTIPDQGWAPSNTSIIPITGDWGDAGSWATSARSAGFLVDQTPQVGDVAQWNFSGDNGQFVVGHVAFVYQVNSDGSIELAQYNLREDSKFSTLHMTRQGAIDTSNGHGPFFVSWPDNFIHFGTRASAAIDTSDDAATPQQTRAPGTNTSTLSLWQTSAHENWLGWASDDDVRLRKVLLRYAISD